MFFYEKISREKVDLKIKVISKTQIFLVGKLFQRNPPRQPSHLTPATSFYPLSVTFGDISINLFLSA